MIQVVVIFYEYQNNRNFTTLFYLLITFDPKMMPKGLKIDKKIGISAYFYP
jgi:hypothetical protein